MITSEMVKFQIILAESQFQLLVLMKTHYQFIFGAPCSLDAKSGFLDFLVFTVCASHLAFVRSFFNVPSGHLNVMDLDLGFWYLFF